MNRDDALTTAGSLINGDRARDYGDARTNFQRIADLWAPILDTPVIPEQVALCLAQLKVARIIQSPFHADSWVDLIGYAALGAELATGEAGGAGEDSVASETGTNAADGALRVGARVRVLGTARNASYYAGCEGAVYEPSNLPHTDWLVRLDLGRGMAHFAEDELGVIG